MWRDRTLGLRALLVSAWVLVGATALWWLASQTAPAYAQGGGSAKSQVAARLAWLSDELQLNPSQKQKIKPFLSNLQHQLLSIQGNPHLSPDQKKTKSLVAAQGAFSNIRTVLNPQQKTKFDSMKEEALNRLAAQKAAQS
jgi:Spy/CpxP family protein refolding chaperone